MSIDQYSICPCGSGKKIKFCKCKDSIHEMERALKMISGGQMVAALDRLNQILDEHPNAAWCLAVKGRLLLELNEDEALIANADRFMRLQPSNPLALTQRAAALGMQGDAQGAADSLLNALAESSESVDPFVLDVSSVLSLLCCQTGNLLTSRCFGGLALSAQGYKNDQMATTAIEEVNRSPDVSTLLKTIPTPMESSNTAEVKERFDEASGLLKAKQILQAETKFESLARSHSDDEAVLRGLLVCAVWRGDQHKQSDLLQKLSRIESSDLKTRARDLAIGLLIQPEQTQISTPAFDITWEIEDVDLLQQELVAAPRCLQLPDDIVRAAGSSDENSVPPRSAFQLIDRELGDLEVLPDAADAPVVDATALLFGKQTDRSARLTLVSVCQRDRDAAVKFFSEFSGVSGEPTVEEASIPLMSAAMPNLPIMKVQGTQAEANRLQSQIVARDFADRVMGTPLKLFGGLAPSAAKEVDDYELKATALSLIVDSYEIMSDIPEAIEAIREQLGVAGGEPIEITDEEQLYSIPLDEIARIKVDSLAENHLFILMQRAHTFRLNHVVKATATRIIGLPLPEDREKEKLIAYMHLVDSSSDPAEGLEFIEQAKQWAAEHDVQLAPLLLAEVGRRLAVGDADGFQRTIKQITTDYGNDPQVMTRLQQMLVGFGLINPDGSPRHAPGEPAMQSQPGAPVGPAGSGGGELWTPDGPPPSQPSGSSGGEGKLWLPGDS